jgi:hypothetical protein
VTTPLSAQTPQATAGAQTPHATARVQTPKDTAGTQTPQDTAGAQISQDTAGQDQAAKPEAPPSVEELKRRLDLLAAEVEQLRSGETEGTPKLSEDDRRVLGLGPSAASVYERKSGVSIAGYGEMLFQRLDASNESGSRLGADSSIDLLRAILYTGYRFNDRFLFNSEVEFEHGGDEISIEFAYLEYQINRHLSVRGGNLLVPLGLVNEFHEPNVFIGTRRPETERRIIPSTWHENGAGLVGTAGPVTFRAYAVNGLNATGFTAAGIRGGRQGGAEATANNWAFAGRADVAPIPGVFAGIGLYQGGSGQGEIDGTDVGTTIVELHGQAQIRGFDVRGLFARAHLDDAGRLNEALGLAGRASVGETMAGGYGQVAYNLLSQRSSRLSLAPFYRFEQLNTQHRVPSGYVADPARDMRMHVLGVELKPIPAIVVKADYQITSNKARTGRDQFSVALGYAF